MRARSMVIALTAALLMVLGACGGSPSGGGGGDGDTIRIGAVLSLTGRYAASAKYVEEGYKYWAQEVNRNGGLAGRQVELLFRDDQSDPTTAANLARSLVDRENVSFVLGPYGSGATDTMAAVMESLQVPMLGTIASDSSIWDKRKLRWTFQAFPSSTYDHEAFLAVVRQLGLNRITIINEEKGFSEAAAAWARQQAEGAGMAVQSLSYPSGVQDFSSIVTKMREFGPQAVSMGGYYEPSITLTKEMISQGFNVPAYHFIQSADGVTAEALGPNVEGIFGRSSWEPQLPTPGNQQFTEGYQRMFGRAPSYHSAAAYAAGQVTQAAFAEAGDDPEKIREFLAAQKVQTIMGTFQVNEKGQQVGLKYVGTQWQNGKKAVIWPEQEATAPVLHPKPNWA